RTMVGGQLRNGHGPATPSALAALACLVVEYLQLVSAVNTSKSDGHGSISLEKRNAPSSRGAEHRGSEDSPGIGTIRVKPYTKNGRERYFRLHCVLAPFQAEQQDVARSPQSVGLSLRQDAGLQQSVHLVEEGLHAADVAVVVLQV